MGLIHFPNFVPRVSEIFVSVWGQCIRSLILFQDNLETKELKLSRYPYRKVVNRFKVIMGRFKKFEIFVHFCSFRSFHEPAARHNEF